MSDDLRLTSFIMNSKTSVPDPTQNELPTSSKFRMKILHFSSPSCFLFQFGFDELEKLENDLKNYYGHPSMDFHILKLEVNMLVVVFLHDLKKFARAKVKSIEEDSVNVVLIDYATTEITEVDKDDIYHMEMKFAEISRKSAVGKIYGMKSQGKNWSEDERNLAKGVMTKGKELRGRVVQVLPFTCFKLFSLDLFDTNGFCIKDILLKEGVGQAIE